jgi:hypothetical protein
MLRECNLTATFRSAAVICVILFFAVAVITQTVKSSPSPTPHPKIHRWFDIETLVLSTRYRLIENAAGSTAGNAQQWQFIGRGRFKLDSRGKYSVVAGLETGNSFTGGWNNTGFGTGSPQTNIYLKHLYFNANPVKPIETEIGGIGFNNGENTEITGFDNDAYLTGERVRIKAPNRLWFDEISLTNGYIGDLNRPSVFRRLRHLDRSNYRQLLVRKRLDSRVSFSADYTFDEGAQSLRQAVHVNIPKRNFVDSVLFENYERIDPQPGYGFAISAARHVTRKFDINGGFAKISHAMFNSDRFPRGDRLFVIAGYKPIGELSISPVIITAVGPLLTTSVPRTRFELIVSYNILTALHHYKIF